MAGYDVVIVGGGPSGLSCAIELQKLGISNCVIEKARYPRHKLCGGLLTEKTFETLASLCDGDISMFKEAFVDEANVVSLWDRSRMLCKVETEHKLRFVDRDVFDNSLKDYYLSLGGNLIDGEEVKKCNFETKVISTQLNDYEYQILVAADGAESPIRKKLGLKLSPMGFCLEALVPRDSLPLDDGVQIHFGILDNGYSWVFPCGDFWKVGLGNECNKACDYIKMFWTFLSIVGIGKHEEARIQGAFIPYGGYLRRPVVYDSVVFVGDAAGMVDPIYGEGLFFALRSGKTVVNSIDYTDGIAFRPKWFMENRKRDFEQIRSGARLKKLFFKPFVQRRFLKYIPEHASFVSRYIDEQVSLYKYSHGASWKMLFD